MFHLQTRKRRILAGIAGFTIMFPATAQAYTGEEPPFGTPPKVPHLYANGLMVSNGLRIDGWGNMTYSNAIAGPVQCRSVFAEKLENPSVTRTIEGKEESYVGAARGIWDLWIPYECGSNCASQMTGFGEATPAELTELQGERGVIRQHLGAVEARLACNGATTTYKGELAPKFKNTGIGIGSPEELGFDTTSGTLSGATTVNGNLKIQGYGAMQMVTAQTP
jgi:hypothetical protein